MAGRTTLYTKTTCADLILGLLRQAGLGGLLAPDDATPQAFLRELTGQIPDAYEDMSPEAQAEVRLRLAFAAQRGWLYEEFGMHLTAMMARDGFMAAFRGLLRRLDDHPDVYTASTIARGIDRLVKPCLSLLSTITPADLQPFARPNSPLWRDGYFARFAFVTPPAGAYSEAQFPRERLTYPATLLTTLHDWHLRLGVPEVTIKALGKDQGRRFVVEHQPLRETIYTLEDDVWEAYYRYDGALRTLASRMGHQNLDGSYGRFATKALRMAGTLASLHDEQGRRTIQLCHWYRGQAIAERWRAGLHRLAAQLVEDVPMDSREQTVEARMEHALRRFGALSIRELHLKTNLSYAEINRAIDPMVHAGAIEVDPKSTRTTRYRLIYQSMNGHVSDEA